MTSFAVGQVWRYHSRPGEESSDLVIHRIELVGSMETLHISVRGLRIRNPRTESGFQDCLPHSPISREALEASVTAMIAERVLPDAEFESGYAHWRDDRGGVFTLTVAEIVDLVERVVSAAE